MHELKEGKIKKSQQPTRYQEEERTKIIFSMKKRKMVACVEQDDERPTKG
jgi:hypothetical protein